MAKVHEAVLLSGGAGERLRPLTLKIPKALIPVLGVPILARQVSWLRRHGVRRVVVACGYLSEKIDEYARTNDLGVELELSVERKKLGTAGALKLALPKVRSEEFFALNGDIISNVDLSALDGYHHRMGAMATITVTPFKSPYGIVTSSGGLLERFEEKPTLPYWINAGIYVISRRIEPRLPEVGGLETDVFSTMPGDIAVYESRDLWVPIDSSKDLRRAEAILYRARADL